MQNNINYGSAGLYPSASSLYGSAYLQPTLTQATAVSSNFGQSSPAAAPSASGSSSTQSQGYLQQVFDMAMQVAQTAIQSVLQTILPIFGLGSATSDASAITAGGIGGSPATSLQSIAGSGLVTNTAAASTKKPETWLTKVEKWFGSLGKFGTSVKNTISSGQEIISPFSDGLSGLWTRAKDFLGGIFGSGSDSLLGSAVSSIASIF